MKLRRFLFAFLISLAAFQFCLAQEKPKAELVFEFGNDGCEILLANMDYFYSELQNNPDSHGYVVISGKGDDTLKKLRYELLINGSIAFRKFDANRINKVRGAETNNLKIQLWKVPAGAEKPVFNEAKWNFVFPPETKSFVFQDYNEQICYSVGYEKAFGEYLDANPNAKGHIVIYEKSPKKYQKQKQAVQKLLSTIPQNRLRFFQVKKDTSNVEFWLVPKNKK